MVIRRYRAAAYGFAGLAVRRDVQGHWHVQVGRRCWDIRP